MTGWTRFLVRRLLLLVLTLLVVATLIFILLRSAPGDPTARLVDPAFPPSVREALLEQFGLDKPVSQQYVIYLKNLVQGDFGTSFFTRLPVLSQIGPGLLNTLILGTTAFIIAYPLAVILGSMMASRRQSLGDSIGLSSVMIIWAAPMFWISMVAVYVFAFRLGWFPLSGMFDIGTASTASYFSRDFLYHLALPTLVTAVHLIAIPLLLTRAAMQSVLGEEYIEFARAKGFSRRRVRYRHAVRNALLPVTTDAAVSIATTMGKLIAVEVVFSWPGIGREMVLALTRKDYPVAQGCFLVMAAMICFMNLVADITYAFLDPRITYNTAQAKEPA